MIRRFGRWRALGVGLALVLGGAAIGAQAPGKDDPASKAKAKLGKAKPARKPAKGAPKKSEETPAPAPVADGTLVFSRDIAPILVANCARCHGGAMPKGQLSMASFNRLMKGGKSGAVLSAGDPDVSRLVQMIKREADVPKMPPGNANLAAETVAKVEAWVKAGALLDAGKDPDADIKTFAATPEDLRRAELAKLSPDQRDKKAEAVALERWKKASSSAAFVVTPEKHVLLFSNLPPLRAKALARAIETQADNVRRFLGTPGAPSLNGPEKLSVYVFNELNAYAEFVRAVEGREVERGDEAHGKLDVETPYLAAVDPLGGRDEPAGAKKAAKSKKDDEPSGPGRSLAGLLTERLAASAVQQAGKPPRWLSLGLGAYFAQGVEPRSPYFADLRATAFAKYRQGWRTKATEALGGEGDAASIRAVGLSLVEWLASQGRPMLSGFSSGMMEGQGQLDEMIRQAFGMDANRDQFLAAWGEFVGSRGTRGR